MIKHDLADLFRQNSIHKKFVINYDGGTITNSDLLMEEFSLEESLCSEEELRFGSCEASVIRFPISNVFTSLNGKVLDVSVVLDHNEDKPLKIGKYKVASDIPTADRKRKDITAYDALYDVINADVADWYNALLPNNDSTVTLKQFRDSFFDYFGIEQVEVALVNDAMIVTKTIQPAELSGSMVANAICELNGCFGHINRDGLMDYVFLKGFTEAVYPSDDLYPAEDLFPEDSNYHSYTKSDYPSGGCNYQEYVVREITGLEIRQDEESAGVFVGERENPYVVLDNFLTYGKPAEEMTTIAQNIFNVINGIEYRPFTLNTFRGNPCVEVGDGIKIYTDNQIIQSYVLHRTMTGIQSLHDDFESNGTKYYTPKLNTVQSQILQLKGKTNTLERTAEETSSRITDLENNVESEFRQAAEEISAKVSKNKIISEINQTAEQIKIQASKIALEGTVTANGNVTIDKDGKITAKNGSFSGTVDATSISIKDKITMYSAGYTLPVVQRDIISYNEKYSDDYKPIVIGDGKSLIEINGYVGDVHSDGIIETYSVAMGNVRIRPKEDNVSSNGSSDYRWTAIYATDGTINTSDRNKKTDIEKISKKYEELFKKLKPVVYRFKDGTRLHTGFISQDIEESLKEVGLTNLEFAGFCKDQKQKITMVDGKEVEEFVYDKEGNPIYNYSIRPAEFISLNTHMIQRAHKIIEQQQSEIDKLKKSVSFLVQKLGGMDNE
jgi:hypothetical protein